MTADSSTSSRGDRSGKRLFRTQAAVPLAVAAVFVVVVPAAWLRFSDFNGSSCPQTLPADNLWPTGAFVGVVGGFFLGGLLGKLTPHRPDAQGTTALIAAQLMLTVFAAALVGVWGYETLAVANPDWLEPITHYVMCIKNVQNDWTLMVFTVSGIIIGRWLWHRPGSYF